MIYDLGRGDSEYGIYDADAHIQVRSFFVKIVVKLSAISFKSF